MFDQSAFVKEAIKTLLHEGLIGLVLTSLMILVFLGSFRATSAVFLSIPLSALATFVVLYMMDSTINTMILGGLALAFSRVIDNSVISLENIYRHLEMGTAAGTGCRSRRIGSEPRGPGRHADHSGRFFPGHLSLRRQQVSIHRARLAVVISLFASYLVAMTVIPLFCSRFLKAVPHGTGMAASQADGPPRNIHGGIDSMRDSTACSIELLDFYEVWVRRALATSGAHRRRLERCIPGQPRHLSSTGTRLLPSNRRRSVHHQSQSPHRYSHRSHRRICRQSRRSHPPHRRFQRSEDGRLEHRSRARLLFSLHHQCRALHRDHASRSAGRITTKAASLTWTGCKGV